MKLKYVMEKTIQIVNAIVIFIGVFFVQQITIFPLTMTAHAEYIFPKLLLSAITFISQGFLIVILYIKLYKGSDLKKLFTTKLMINILLVLIAALAIQISTTYLQDVNILSDTQNQKELSDIYMKNPVGLMIETILFAPLLEELIFRGFFYHGWVSMCGRNIVILTMGILIDSTVFAYLHTGLFSINATPYFMVGILFSVAYIKSGRIEIPMLGHIFLNLLAFV